MTEKKTVLSSERVAIRIAEIKESRYISYYNIPAVVAGILSVILFFSIIFMKGSDYYRDESFSYFMNREGSLVYTLISLIFSIIFLLIFRNIHVKAIESLKDLKEETENLENKINTSNDNDNRKIVICGLDRLNEVDKEMIKKLINISDFPVIEGEEDLRYISTKDKKEENKDLLKYLTNNQALLESIGITKVTNYYDIAVIYKIDKFVMNYLK
ncbi:MAG: hypothetical protein VZS44_08780 [Bacilli bacterium]|nr:hypothetical protein [Bacilli bacterium]